MAAPNHTKDAFPNETRLGGFKPRPYPAGKGPHRFETAPVTRRSGGIWGKHCQCRACRHGFLLLPPPPPLPRRFASWRRLPPMPAMSPRPQVHLEAEYTATLAGLPIGHGTWAIEIAEDQYTAAASGATSGLLRIFTGARGASASRGSFNGEQTLPTSYVATIDFDRSKWDDVRMALAGGNVKDLSAEPPLVSASRSHSGERRRPPRRRRSHELDDQPRRRQRRSGVAFSLRPQGRGIRRPRALRPAQRVQAHRDGQGRTRLSGAGRGLRGVFRADLRLRAGAGR